MFELPNKRSRAHMAAAKRQHNGLPPFSFGPPPPPETTDVIGPDPATDTPDSDTDLPPLTSTVVVVVPPSSTTQVQPTTQAPPPSPPPASTTSTTPLPPPPPATTSSTTSTTTSTTPAAVNTPPATTSSTSTSSTSTSTSTPVGNTATTPTPATTPAANTRSKAATNTVVDSATTIVHVNTVTGGAHAAGHASITSGLPSATSSPSSGESKGVLAGGIAAAVVACIGILFALVWAIRKCRGRRDDFDTDDFKRKSMALPDEPSAWQPRPNGDASGPRPPTMLERVNVAPSVAPGYAPGPAYAPDFVPGYAPQFTPGYAPAFAPHGGPAPWTPGAVVPDFAYAQGQSQNPHISGYSTASFSPGDVVFSSPQSPPATAMAAQPVFFVPGSPARGFGGMDARGAPAIGESVPSTPTYDAPPVRESHYVDLDRSSVTPFQARQYSELQARLDQIAPPPLPQKGASPFADPVLPAEDAHAHAEHEIALDDTSEVQHVVGHADDDDDEEELAPPAAPYDAPRITSMPPTLPELLPRAFSPVTLGAEDEFNFTLHAGSATLAPDAFPTTPNPPVTPTFAPQQQRAPAPAPAPAARPETMYDMEDAYDGI